MSLVDVVVRPPDRKLVVRNVLGTQSERARLTAGLGPFVLEAVTDAGKKQSMLGLPGSRSHERTRHFRY
jgi:hypothetical protein